MTTPRVALRSEPAMAAAADIAAVVLFVVVGRNNHDEGNAVSGIVKVAAPFLLALVFGWVAALRVARRPYTVRFGAVVWAVTLVVGMVLRRTAFGRGTALPFMIVATVFLGLAFVGWRALLAFRSRTHRTP